MTHFHPPWSRVLLEKLIVAQVIRELPAIGGDYHVHMPVESTPYPSTSLKIYFNIILSYP
jgi:hypothetical protein